MLRYRLLVGPLLIAAVLGLLWLDQWLGPIPLPDIPFGQIEGQPRILPLSDLANRPELPPGLIILATLLAMVAVAARELAGMFQAKGMPVAAPVLWIGAAIGLVLMYVSPGYAAVQPQLAWYASWLLVAMLLALRVHTAPRRVEGALPVAAGTMLGLVYLGTLPSFFLAIRHWHTAWVIAAVVLVTKACDIGAYFTGQSIGRTKMIPWLSPGKTWEGLMGGLLTSALVGAGLVALGRSFDLPLARAMSLPYAAIAGAAFGAVGQLGDLVVSLFKRDAGLKDSGQLLPGFGGILDIMDSPLLVAPVAYWLLLPFA